MHTSPNDHGPICHQPGSSQVYLTELRPDSIYWHLLSLYDPALLNLQSYWGLQEILKSYQWTHIQIAAKICLIYRNLQQKCRFLELHDRTERFAVWINPMWNLSITWVNLFYRWRICSVDRKSLLMTQCLIFNCFVSFCAGCQFVDTPVISRLLHSQNVLSEPAQNPMTQGKIDLRNESGRPMKVKVVGEVSEKWN